MRAGPLGAQRPEFAEGRRGSEVPAVDAGEGDVLAPGRVASCASDATGVVVEGVRIGADLGGDEPDDASGHDLAGTERPAGVPETSDVQCI